LGTHFAWVYFPRRVSSLELSDRLHKFETGIIRDLFQKYHDGGDDFNVAYAIVVGIIDPKDIPDDLIAAIEKHIQFYKSLKNASKLRLPGE
jgi:hypothetical protein